MTTTTATRTQRRLSRSVMVVDVRNLPAPGDAAWIRWLRPSEVAVCRHRARPVVHLAVRLMAKRAALALLGWRHAEAERNLEVLGDSDGRPRLIAEGAFADSVARAGLGSIAVSLSHTDTHAAAIAVAWSAPVHASTPAPACGIDLLDLPRWQLAVRRSGPALTERVTGPLERAADSSTTARGPERSATRFALKECVVKVMGGFPRGSGFHDVVVTFDDRGRPDLRSLGAVQRHLGASRLETIEASITQLAPGLLQATVVMGAAGHP